MSDQGNDAHYEDTRTKLSRHFDPHREPHQNRGERWMQGLLPLSLGALFNTVATYPGQKTKAPSPCWRESTTKPVKWQHMTPDAAKELYRQAEDFERQTRRPGRQNGMLGRNGLAVMRAMIFFFLNYTTGQLDPGYKRIAKQACISERSAARGLAALKAAGVLNWIRRCTPIIEAGRCILEQITNAYALIPSSQWLGYRPTPKRTKPPQPERGTWGDHPPLPDAITAASEARRLGASQAGILGELASDPRDILANALASLGRAMQGRKPAAIPDMPT
jgi:hypothetical protein